MNRAEREGPPAAIGNHMPDRTPKDRAGAISLPKRGKSYKPLERHFRRKEFNYKQLVRQGNVAVYSQTWRDCSEPRIAFEVVCLRRHNGKKIKGQWVEPSELYPSPTDWGKYAFTFTDKDAAFAKLRELSRRPGGSEKAMSRRVTKNASQ